MNTKSKKGIIYTVAGTVIGVAASMGVYLIVGFFWGIPADASNIASFGVAGLIMGAYFGYVLSHFNYEGLYKHLHKKA